MNSTDPAWESPWSGFGGNPFEGRRGHRHGRPRPPFGPMAAATDTPPPPFEGPADEENDGPRQRLRRARRGGPFGPGFGPGMPPGFPRGFPGPRGRGRGRGRRTARGDIRAAVLALVAEQPRHGYEIIQEIAERSGGAWRPSPGSVYPTLQMLEDLGYVTSSQQEGKKVYSITEEGRRYLTEQQSTVDDIRSRITAGWDAASRPEVADLMHELQMLGRALFRHGTRGALQDPARLQQLREIVSRARREVETLGDTPPSSSTPPSAPAASEPRIV
jgi:DNA-binding PadR family transcriptional regulator